jgi:glycosyltransferase involved in cell wall biosynthesis
MFSHALDFTGACWCQLELATALRARRLIDPVVVSPHDGPLREQYERNGIEVAIQRPGRDHTVAAYEKDVTQLMRQIRSRGAELVYGNTLKAHWAIEAARRLELPSLWNVLESEPWQTYYSDLPDGVAVAALSGFAEPYRVIFGSNASRAVFEALNTAHNFCVIHHGLDLDTWNRRRGSTRRPHARASMGLEASDVAILQLGTVCERKGQQDLARALACVDSATASRVRCFIVGDRPSEYSRTLARLVSTLPLPLRERVHVVAETADVAPFYEAADLFVCASRVESYPRVTLEAMASGLPIISTPVFGLSEQLVDQVNAVFYEPGDVGALAAALQIMVKESDRRHAMGDASRVVLAGLTGFDETVACYADIFAEAADAG